MAEFKTTQIWARMVKYFFEEKLNIGVYYSHFRYDIFPEDYITILLPYSNSRNMLSYDDIQEIREFFVKDLEMKEGNKGFKKEFEDMREDGIKNGILNLEFYYNALFVIEIPLIYAKIDNKEYFFLSQIIIENKEDDEEMNEMLINKAMKILEGTNVLKELMEEWKKYEEKEKRTIEETDKYPRSW
jgi:hypothetical protein